MTQIPKSAMDQTTSIKDYLRTYLRRPKDENTLSSLLTDVGEHYHADRVYIFEFDKDGQTLSNVFEWCREGVSPEIDNLQNVPIENVSDWLVEFEEKGELCIRNVEEEYPMIPTYTRCFPLRTYTALLPHPSL